MRRNVNQIQYNTNLLHTGSLSINDSNILVNANEALKLQTQALATSSNDLSNQAKWYHQNNATTSLAKNNLVTTNSNYATNQKTVHQIYARTIATGNANFTPTEITTLYNIAQQCVSYGGPAVLEARPMYALIDPTINFESVPCSLGNNRWGLNDEAETKTEELLVYPNPANDVLNIYYPSEKLTDVKVEVYNLTGTKIKSYNFEITSNTLQIATLDLAQGLYVVKVNANNNSYKSVKIQVIK